MSSLNTPAVKPMLAKINPTSPLGIIAVPTMSLVEKVSFLRRKPEASFPITAEINNRPVIIQTDKELQSIALRLRDKPIATKNN